MEGWPDKATVTHFSLSLLLLVEVIHSSCWFASMPHVSSFPGHSVRHCGAHNMEKAYAAAGKQHGGGALSIAIFRSASADCKECIVLGFGRRDWHARLFAAVNKKWQTDKNNLEVNIHKWNAFKLLEKTVRIGDKWQTGCYQNTFWIFCDSHHSIYW